MPKKSGGFQRFMYDFKEPGIRDYFCVVFYGGYKDGSVVLSSVDCDVVSIHNDLVFYHSFRSTSQ